MKKNNEVKEHAQNFKKIMTETKREKNLEPFIVNSQGKQLTTNTGVRINDTDNSLRVGPRGPTLMEDFHFREKIMHFDHERIPERVVHARGSGAHGYFQVYEPLTKYTKAKFLENPNKKTPVFVRFSTVAGSRGSADTVRDVRGFATRFYTEDGNFDLVGNNIPVFFIQDAIKFPDLVHAVKPEQDNEVPQASTAHDTFWDFVVNTPETVHMVMWLMSDRAIPRSFRMMEGFGVNTYRLVNEQGESFFVKFHWKPLLGVHSLVWDEAQRISGKDPDFHRKDLWEAIEDRAYPEYELGIQIIPECDECKFDFDILDATKIWPEELVPVQRVGKLVLNRNPDNFFSEVEQVAFCVGNLVPGIDVSDDPLLQGRLFSYMDTQLTRLGGPNFNQIPINKPLVPVVNNQRDGFHQMMIPQGKTAYHPNSLNDGYPMPGLNKDEGYVHYPANVTGTKIRQRSETFNDHFSQAILFWNSMSEAEKMHIVKAFHFEVGKVIDLETRQKVADMFANVDYNLATAIALGVGVERPSKQQLKKVLELQASKALSMVNTPKDTIKSRKIAVLVMPGFNGKELQKVKTALTANGAKVDVISQYLTPVKSMEDEEVTPDKHYVSVSSVLYDAVYIPGGERSIDAMSHQGYVQNFILEAFKHCKAIGATSEAVVLLKEANPSLQEAKLISSQDNTVNSDLGIVTSNNASDEFNKALIQAIAQHRHWAREKNENVPA
ncbi:MAG TPA: catalase [Candidatus Sulfotelmatobacter sp.]|nr:catalase [Candidatus Sulfotelmatobacter sp.]